MESTDACTTPVSCLHSTVISSNPHTYAFQQEADADALLELQTVWGIGPSKAQELWDRGIRSIADLKVR